jgi:ABC-type phosphate transport system ATPase subunit
MRSRIAIRADDLSAGYGGDTVLSAVSFTVPIDENTAIVGPGGSGKSTLLRSLTTNADPAPANFWRRHNGLTSIGSTAFLSQRPTGGTGNVGQLLLGREYEHARAVALIEECWQSVPPAARYLASALDTPLADASFDTMRLAEFTAVVSTARDCMLLLDEPEANLRDECLTWITSKLQEIRGTRTAVIVTHHLRFARSVADSLTLLVNGRIIESNRTAEFFRNPEHPRTAHYLKMGS